MVLEAEPEFFRLVKCSGLWAGVCVGEGVVVRLLGCRLVALNRVQASDEMSAVEVVFGADGLPGLFVDRDTRVEMPVVASVVANELITVDVDAGRDREAPCRV